MAELNKALLGTLKGAIGNIVFRQFNGKCLVSLRKDSHKSGMDPYSVLRRDKFKIAVNLASVINSIESLKSIWEESKPTGVRTYDYIMQSIYKQIVLPDLSSCISLIPYSNLLIETNKFQMDDSILSIKCNIPKTNQLNYPEWNLIKLVGAVCLSNSLSGYKFIPCQSVQQFIYDEEVLININVSSIKFSNMDQWNKIQKILYVCVIYDKDGKVSGWSDTGIIKLER